ncbi:NAD(P)/FAD-dependent oxidoreductase [Spongiivirga citrea]|uniref:FAD-dependent oxidoreductase n=1 Tax=Spongiivirga citrea TaxID=1481457 RepID=A0A6M0CLF1_9FLAO|nr:FAD-dependent oxidoreductase [Spongiivirga citrea]NER18775.1 FAD-dependent oxidoreductase [Spongiivirga citrea]
MKVDYIIVGLGLAGISMIERLEQNNKRYFVFNDDSQQATKTAAGIYNPTNLKRYTAVWNAIDHLKEVPVFFDQIEKRLGIVLRKDLPIYRRFASIEEQNNWIVASDKPKLAPFLSNNFIPNRNNHLITSQDFGEVLQTGRVDTNKMIQAYRSYLVKKDRYKNELFNHADIVFNGNSSISYKGIDARTIIFCEGYGAVKNPFFSYLPLQGNKGEYIVIESEELKMDFIFKAGLFVVPLGNDQYKVGATFNREDKTNGTTQEAQDEISEKLKKIVSCDFKIVGQVAGIRPTTKDRKPFLGRHPEHHQLAILNGFGSRGIMMAPTLSKQLFDHLENNTSLDKEVDINRYLT